MKSRPELEIVSSITAENVAKMVIVSIVNMTWALASLQPT